MNPHAVILMCIAFLLFYIPYILFDAINQFDLRDDYNPTDPNNAVLPDFMYDKAEHDASWTVAICMLAYPLIIIYMLILLKYVIFPIQQKFINTEVDR